MSEIAPTPEKKKARLPWRRRVLRWLVVLVILLIAVRLLFAMLLPAAINRVAALYNVSIDYERSELNLLSGDAGLWHLAIKPSEGGEAIANIEYVRGNISVLQLLLLRLEVWRAEVDGVSLNVVREADGTVPLLNRVMAALPSNNAPPPPPPAADGLPLDLTAPIKLDALRVNNVAVLLVDRAVSPAVEAKFNLNFRLSDVRSTVRPTTFELDVWLQPGLDFLRVEGSGKGTSESIDAEMTFLMRGLHADALAAYSLPFGLAGTPRPMAAGAKAVVNLKRLPAPAKGVSGSVNIDHAGMRYAGGDVAAVDRVAIDLESLSAEALKVRTITIDGGRVNAGRNARGNFYIGEVEFVGATDRAAAAPRAATPPRNAPTQTASTVKPGAPAKPFVWSLGEMKIGKAAATFRDDFLSPTNSVVAQLDAMSVRNLSYDPAKPDARAEVLIAASVPGVIESARLSGFAVPFSGDRTLQLSTEAQGIRPDALGPYLKAFGIESTLNGATFKSELSTGLAWRDNRWVGQLKLSDTQFVDAGVLLFGFPLVSVDGLAFAPEQNAISVASIKLQGPTLPAQRDAEAMLGALGLRLKQSAAAAATLVAPTTGPSVATERTPLAVPDLTGLPTLRIDQLEWSAVNVTFFDALHPTGGLKITDAGLTATSLTLGTAPAGTAPGQIKAWLATPGLVGRLDAQGTLARPSTDGYALVTTIQGNDITAAQLAPYLSPLGIEPVLTAGDVSARAEASVDFATDKIRASIRAADLSYRDGETVLLAAAAGELAADIDPQRIAVARASLQSPRMSVTRHEDGRLIVGGFKIPTSSPNPEPFKAPVSPLLPLPAPVVLESVALDDAQIDWTDRATATPVKLRATASAAIGQLTLGGKAAAGTFSAQASVGGALRAVNVAGTLSAEPDWVALQSRVKADGVKLTTLQPYIPPGLEANLRDGKFDVSLTAEAGLATDGGYAAKLDIADLRYTDGEQPLAIVRSFKVHCTRFDPWGGVIALKEISSAGVELDAELTESGAPQLLGLKVVPVDPGSVVPATQPTESVFTSAAPASAAPADVASIVAHSRKTLPLLAIDVIDLCLDRLTVRNNLYPDAKNLTIADARLRTLNRLEWAGPQPESLPPTQLEVSAKVDPVLTSVKAAATIAPFAEQPSIELDFSAAGVRGDALTELVPPLKQFLNGERLTDGRASLRLDAQLRPDRRGGGPADYSRGFGADVAITNTAFRNGAEGQVLAGVESIRCEGIRVEPAAGNVIFKTVEIAKPAAYVLRDDQGVQVLGIVAKLPEPSAETTPGEADAATQPAEAETQVEAEVVATSTQPAAQASAGGEVRIDKLQISGLDVRIEDRSVDPPIVLPLNSLDLEATGLSNKALVEARPVRFSMVMSAGKVELPKSAAGAGNTAPTDAAPELEPRDLFSQVAAGGRVVLYPQPKGWAKLSVNGLELSSIRGFASEVGVTLGGGVLDTSVDARFKDDGLIETRNRIVLTDLKLSEPAGGPIERTLKLPAPLDAAIAAVQDADGSITLPINVPLKNGELQMGQIVGSATGAIGQVIITALASAPVKVVAGVGNLLGGDQRKQREPRTFTIDFATGDAALEATQIDSLRKLIQDFRKNKNMELTLRHDMAAEDVSITAVRASPPPGDLQALASRLRGERTSLKSQRAHLAAEARSQSASLTAAQARPSVDALREVDRRLASVENSLDLILDLLKPGADRQADRRTRAAALELGQQRLDEVRRLLIDSEAPNASTRVRAVAPQFAVAPDALAGRVVITVIEKKK